MPPRFTYLGFHIDTNRINAKQKIEAMNLLEHWFREGVIRINMPEPATKESFSGDSPRRRNKASQYAHTFTYADTPEEKNRLQKIENILFPGGANGQNQMNDVEIVFNAGKYGVPLITNDGGSKKQPGGILGNKDQLKAELGIAVMNDADAVKSVRHAIKNRDGRARKIAEMEGLDLPEWVGKDSL